MQNFHIKIVCRIHTKYHFTCDEAQEVAFAKCKSKHMD